MGMFKRIDPVTAELAGKAAEVYEKETVNLDEIRTIMDDLLVSEQFMEIFEHLFKKVRTGEDLAIETSDRELTSQEAADFLKVSRPHIVQLIDNGAIPAHSTGSHRRVLLKDLISYKAERQRRNKAMEMLSEDNVNYEDNID